MGAKTILVVDDNRVNNKFISDLLQFWDYQVLAAHTAEEGLQLLRSCKPALILMDIRLPGGIDGYAAAQIIKQDPDLAGIPVVALTAQAMIGDRERALQAGCDGYITKPFGIKEFQEYLEMFLK